MSDQVGRSDSEYGCSGNRLSTAATVRRPSAIRTADAATRRIRSTMGHSAATGGIAFRTDAANASAGLRANAGYAATDVRSVAADVDARGSATGAGDL